MKKLFLMAIAASMLFACDETGKKPLDGTPITALEFTKAEITIEQLSQMTLPLEITPVAATNFADIKFSYEGDTAAYVSADGSLLLADTLGRTGTVTIIASVGDIKSNPMKVNVKTMFDLVEIQNWFGHWPMGGLRKNPDFDPDLTYAALKANIEAGSPDSTKTYRQYCDSIGYSMMILLCNGAQCTNYGEIIGVESAASFNLYVSYLYRRGTAANSNEQVFLLLNTPTDLSNAYTVDENWVGDFEKNPEAKAYSIMAGWYDEAQLAGYYLGQVQDAGGIFKGSRMTHNKAGGYWVPANTSLVTKANIQFCVDSETKENFLGNCEITVENPKPYGSGNEISEFRPNIYTYKTGEVGPIESELNAPKQQRAARMFNSNFMRHSEIVKSLNLAAITKLAVSNPDIMK